MLGISGVRLYLAIGAFVLALSAIGTVGWKVHAYMAEHDQAIADCDKLQGQVSALGNANRGLSDQLNQQGADLKFSQGQVAAYAAADADRKRQLETALRGLKNAKGYSDPMSPVLGAGFDIVRQQWGQGPPVPAGGPAQAGH